MNTFDPNLNQAAYRPGYSQGIQRNTPQIQTNSNPSIPSQSQDSFGGTLEQKGPVTIWQPSGKSANGQETPPPYYGSHAAVDSAAYAQASSIIGVSHSVYSDSIEQLASENGIDLHHIEGGYEAASAEEQATTMALTAEIEGIQAQAEQMAKNGVDPNPFLQQAMKRAAERHAKRSEQAQQDLAIAKVSKAQAKQELEKSQELSEKMLARSEELKEEEKAENRRLGNPWETSLDTDSLKTMKA